MVLEDAWAFDAGAEKPVTERFVTEIPPERTGGGYRIGEAVLKVSPEAAERSAVSTETPPGERVFYCIDFPLPETASSFRAELVLLED